MALRGGMVGILLIGSALYFTDAGSVMFRNIRGLSDNCYGAISGAGSSISYPVCGALSRGVDGLERFGSTVSATLNGWRQRVMGNRGLSGLDSLTQELHGRLAGLTSSNENLTQMMRRGSGVANSGSAAQRLQQAVDSFAIGQRYLSDPEQASQAMPWLKRGAAQPEGFGMMSQLTLGNLYRHGGKGVQANPKVARAYLQQARDSLATLSSSNSPQALQLLQALPATPQAMQQQIDQAMREIGEKK